MPGTASFLPLRAGIQKEWMTSLEVLIGAILAPDGDDESSAVTTSPGVPNTPSPSVS